MLAMFGMLLILPTLNVGLLADDFFVSELLTGKIHYAHPGAFFGLFTFADGLPEHIQTLKDMGQVPWWVVDNAQLSFWRPLAELTHWLDYQFWPQSPVLMHLHTVLWYGLLVWLLGKLYRMLDADPLHSGLATLIFAVSTMHLLTVVWLAARNQLMAGCFLLLTLMSFHRWRQAKGGRYGLLAMLTMLLGLMSAEAAIATVGYLAAYVLAFEQDTPWVTRLKALLPFLLIVVVWRMVYNHLGYGSSGSGGYIDPGSDPLRFAQTLVLRMPALLLAELYGVSSSVLNILPYPQQLLYAAGAASAVALSILAGHYFGLWATPRARFYGLGALFALVPVCAALPNDRLLLNAEFGLCALLAMLFVHVAGQHRRYTGGLARGAKVVVAVLMLVHLLAYPIATTSLSVLMHKMVRVPGHDEPLSLPDAGPDSPDHVILVNPPNALFVGYYPVVRRYFGVHNAKSTQALASGDQALTLTVVDDTTLRISAPRGIGETVSRDFYKHPFRVGDTVRAGHFTVSIEAVTPQGKAQTARFTFDTPLHAAPWRLYAWGDAGYEPFSLPAAGHSVTLAPANIGKLVTKQLKSRG